METLVRKRDRVDETVKLLRQGIKVADQKKHHKAMRRLLDEIDPMPTACVRCGLEKKMTLSLVDPEIELLNGNYYIGYSSRGRNYDEGPYVLSVSPDDYRWLCMRCNVLEGQPLLRHNLVHVLAFYGLFGWPEHIPRLRYAMWSDETGGIHNSPGRR